MSSSSPITISDKNVRQVFFRAAAENVYYRFTATALDNSGNRSVSSTTVTYDLIAPASPTKVGTVTGDNWVRVSWTPPEKSADGSALPDLAKYRVYYGTDGPDGPFPSSVEVLVGTSPLQATLSGLASNGNTVYFIVVKALDSAGNESAASEWVAARPLVAHWVPGEYSAIQDAINAAQSGETVMVSPRAEPYPVTHLYVNNNVTLRSEAGPDETKIDGSGGDVTVQALPGAKIIGFTLSGGTATAYGVRLWISPNVEIRNNVITGNEVGMYIGGVWDALIANNTVVANRVKGLHVTYWVKNTVRIVNNIIAENGTYGIYDYAGMGYPTLEYNDVWGPTGTPYFGIAAGKESISEDPRFINPADGNYHLKRDSLCRDKGDPGEGYNDYWETQLGVPGKKFNDMGAYGGPDVTWRVDSDRDGLWDWTEDADHDGVLDPGETDPYKGDNDNDGKSDGPIPGTEDFNANGIFEPDLGETDPRNPDTDGDGIQDGTETGLIAPECADTDLAVFVPDADPTTTTDPLIPDSDGDGLLDGQEDADHNGAVGATESDPRRADSDGDGFGDGVEVAGGSDPLDAASVPNHPPAISNLTVAERTDGSGLAEATFTGVDAEGDSCTLPVREASLDGATWVALPIVAADPRNTAGEPMSFIPEGRTYTLVWDVRAAFGAIEDGEVYVRLQPHGGRVEGETAVGAPFALDTVAPRVVISAPSLSNCAVTPAIGVSDGLDAAPALSMTLDGFSWSGGTVAAEGEHRLIVTARDDFGNAGSAEALFTVDMTPPQIAFEGAVDGGIYASDVSVSFTVSDVLDPAPSVAANYPSPHLFDFSGHYTVQVTATDAAGNSSARSLSFAIYDLADLPAVIGAKDIEPGLKSSLLSKVQNALAARDRGSIDAAVNLLEAFMHAVEAQRGKKILPADADHLLEFAANVITLLRNSWSALALGEVFVSGGDPALLNWEELLSGLEANAVSRIVLELYEVEGAAAGRLLLAEMAAFAGSGQLNFAPPFAFDLAVFLAEADRRGMDVFAGMRVLGGTAAPADEQHLGHLQDVVVHLLSTYPGLRGISLMGLEAPGEAAAVTSLVAGVKSVVAAVPGFALAVVVGAASNEQERLSLSAERGQDLASLGASADLLYLEAIVHEDADGNGLPDHPSSWPGEVVTYVGSLGLSAGLVPVMPTYDCLEPFEDVNASGTWESGEPYQDQNGDGQWGVSIPMTPERITAVASGLPGSLIRGIAVYRASDTSVAEWSALLNSHPR